MCSCGAPQVHRQLLSVPHVHMDTELGRGTGGQEKDVRPTQGWARSSVLRALSTRHA